MMPPARTPRANAFGVISHERFRSYLARSAQTIGAVRDYIETCLRTSGPQYHRALQDLVNHTARLIGFEVEFGFQAATVRKPVVRSM
jgi:hypothetical protein